MPKLSEWGVVHLLLPIILLLGIIGTVYLITAGPLKLFPKAGGGPVGPETSFYLIQLERPKVHQCPVDWWPDGFDFVCPLGEPSTNIITVQLYARSDIEAANLFAAKLKFTTDLLEVSSVQINPAAEDLSCGGIAGKACPNEYKCQLDGNYPDAQGKFIKNGVICAQVITRACSNTDPTICKDFPTPCDVPEGWVKESSRVTSEGGTSSSGGVIYPGKSGLPGFIKNVIDQSFDNNEGTISIVGGVSDPGYKTDVGQPLPIMATIVFNIKKEGIGKITFDDSSAIYSNANNTNILTAKRDIDIDTSAPKFPIQCTSDYDCKVCKSTYCGPMPSCPVEEGNPNDACSAALKKYEEACNSKCQPTQTQSCSYTSTQARVQKNLNDPWEKTKTITLGEKIRVGGFHDETGLLADDTIITVLDPQGAPLHPIMKEETITPTEVGTYTVIVTTDKQKGSTCEDKIEFTVKNGPIPTNNVADLNKDGKTDLIDASVFLSKCTSSKIYNQPSSVAPICDLNKDGKINVFDLGTLIQVLISNGVIKGFPHD